VPKALDWTTWLHLAGIACREHEHAVHPGSVNDDVEHLEVCDVEAIAEAWAQLQRP